MVRFEFLFPNWKYSQTGDRHLAPVACPHKTFTEAGEKQVSVVQQNLAEINVVFVQINIS